MPLRIVRFSQHLSVGLQLIAGNEIGSIEWRQLFPVVSRVAFTRPLTSDLRPLYLHDRMSRTERRGGPHSYWPGQLHVLPQRLAKTLALRRPDVHGQYVSQRRIAK